MALITTMLTLPCCLARPQSTRANCSRVISMADNAVLQPARTNDCRKALTAIHAGSPLELQDAAFWDRVKRAKTLTSASD